jgi:hypothetical protein
MTRLTKRAVDAAEPSSKRYTLFDDELKGFGLRAFSVRREVLDRRV